MADTFRFKICTQAAVLFDGTVEEVILPSHDGEVGILAGHQNFLGLLGTGALKLVTGGNDFWFMVSAGLYEVTDGALTVLTELAEPAERIDYEAANSRVEELQPEIAKVSEFTEDHAEIKQELERAQARMTAYRRTNDLH